MIDDGVSQDAVEPCHEPLATAQQVVVLERFERILLEKTSARIVACADGEGVGELDALRRDGVDRTADGFGLR